MTTPNAPETAGQFVHDVQPIPSWANIVLPRFGETTLEDLLAEAASQGRTHALNRCETHFPAFNLHVMSNTTDDIRFTAAQSISSEPLDIATFANDLTRIFGCPVNVAPVEQDVPLQWVEFDQFVIGLDGTSTWQITEPQDLSALRGFSKPEASTTEVWAGPVTAGTAMVIPRGWGFAATEVSDSSCVAVALGRWTGLDIIAELSRPAGNWPLLRASAPVDIAAATESYDGDVYRENKFGELLAEIASLEQVDSCLARLQAQVRQPAEPLAAPIGPEAVFRLNSPTGVFWAVTDDPDEILVAFSGMLMRIETTALPAFASIANGEATRIVDLPLTETASGSADLINELASHGVIVRA